MKKIAIILFLFIGCSGISMFGQDFTPPSSSASSPSDTKKDKTPFWSWDKVYTGGGLGLQFGTVTLINLSPNIGYKITKRYSAGIGISYMYYSDKNFRPPYHTNIYGGSVFNRFLVTNFLFLHAEYEMLNGAWDQQFPNHRFNLNNVWVGGGLRQGTDKAAINLMVLWNLNDQGYVQNPQIRMGVSIGL